MRLFRHFPKQNPPEFIEQRGAVQRSGDPSVYGIPERLPTNIPVEPQPGGLRHVYSTFESRPIGAYDFEAVVNVNPGDYP